MFENYNKLSQIGELDQIKVVMDEEKVSYASSSRKKEEIFAKLLERLWREGEKAESLAGANH